MDNQELTLPESLILLALNDETGKKTGSYIDYALAGAGLAELALRGVLRESTSEPGKPPNRFILSQSVPTNDPYLDGCLEAIQKVGAEKPPKKLVSVIAGTHGLTGHLLARLVERGILRKRTRKVFLFFTQTLYPEAVPEPERALKQRLANVMFGNGPVEPRDSVLIALAKQTGLLRPNFDKQLLKEHHKRIEEIASGKMLATTATKETINAIQTAIMVAVIVPVLVT